jgi:pilus assembly protein CpaB
MAINRKAVIIVAVISVSILAFASVSLYNYLQTQEERVKAAIEEAVATEKVIVAAADIPLGTALEASQVKTVDWPAASVPQGAFSSPEELAGRVALQTFLIGEPLMEGKLMPMEGPRGIMTYKIPEGHRAMTVGVDQVSGVAGFVTPNNMVDIVLTTTPPGRKHPLSKIVLQNVPVLATGQIIEQKEGEPVIVPTVTLDVTPEEAEKLAMSTSQGRLQLLLRRSGDVEILRTTGTTITRVISEAGKARARPARFVAKKAVKKIARPAVKKPAVVSRRARPRMETVSVEVWRNNVKTVQTFKVAKEGK